MSLFAIYLYLALVLPFSSATHPFDQLRADGFYPMTTYNNSLVFDAASSDLIPVHGTIRTNWVYQNLVPDPRDSLPLSRGLARGSAARGLDLSYIFCYHTHLPVSDCEAAINMIPTGHLIFDPQDPSSLELPRPLQKFRLPAAFRAGKCVVYVKYNRFSTFPDPAELQTSRTASWV
jgi:hypothetical protein